MVNLVTRDAKVSKKQQKRYTMAGFVVLSSCCSWLWEDETTANKEASHMTPSCAALRLGYLPWMLKLCQESLWEPKVTDILDVHDPLDGIHSALAAFAHRMAGIQLEAIAELVNRMRLRHRRGADLNVEKWHSLLAQEPGNTMAHYRDYLKYLRRDETAKMFRSWQKEDWQCLHDSLKPVIDGERRLEGYRDIGDHIGEVMDGLAHGCISAPLSEDQWGRVTSGIKKLPLREQREIEPYFPARGDDTALVLVFGRTIRRLGHFLSTHEDYLTAKPHWDGRTISYRGRSAQIKVQKNGVIGIILDAGESAGWEAPFSFVLPADLDQRSVTDAVYYFNHTHRVIWLAVNGTTARWHQPVPMSSE
jgi:hypothetical protein